MNNLTTSPPSTFWVISVAALIWNLLGVFSFYSQVFITEEALAALPEAQRALFEAYPAVMEVIYAIAVLTGVGGSIGLLLRKSWAVPMFLISLLAVLVQMAHSIFMTDAIKVMGATSVIMPVLLIGISLFLWYYAKKAKARGWLA